MTLEVNLDDWPTNNRSACEALAWMALLAMLPNTHFLRDGVLVRRIEFENRLGRTCSRLVKVSCGSLRASLRRAICLFSTSTDRQGKAAPGKEVSHDRREGGPA